jgi:hypothetical protein
MPAVSWAASTLKSSKEQGGSYTPTGGPNDPMARAGAATSATSASTTMATSLKRRRAMAPPLAEMDGRRRAT